MGISFIKILNMIFIKILNHFQRYSRKSISCFILGLLLTSWNFNYLKILKFDYLKKEEYLKWKNIFLMSKVLSFRLKNKIEKTSQLSWAYHNLKQQRAGPSRRGMLSHQTVDAFTIKLCLIKIWSYFHVSISYIHK